MKYLTQEVLSVVINLSLTENIYWLFPTEIHFFCNHANKKICIDFTDDFVWVSISLRVQLYLFFSRPCLQSLNMFQIPNCCIDRIFINNRCMWLHDFMCIMSLSRHWDMRSAIVLVLKCCCEIITWQFQYH